MKYRRQKTHLTKYTSCKTAAEKERLLKLSKFKRRFMLILFSLMIISSVLRQSPTATFLLNFSSNESDIMIFAKDFLTDKFSFLNSLGKSGAKFCDDYLRPPGKETVLAKSNTQSDEILSESSAQSKSTIVTSVDATPVDASPADIANEETIDSAIETPKTNTFSPTLPHPGEITSPFGERIHPISGEAKIHNGIDIAAAEGDEIKAIESGIIEKAEYNQYSGNFIVIRHSDTITSSYAHMSKLNVKSGDEVSRGDIIGFAGSTGSATGPHLHMEIRINSEAVNPEDYFSQG